MIWLLMDRKWMWRLGNIDIRLSNVQNLFKKFRVLIITVKSISSFLSLTFWIIIFETTIEVI